MSKEFTFNGQRPDETVEEIVKNHPFVLFWPGVKTIIVLLVPTATLIFFGASLLFTITTLVCVPIAPRFQEFVPLRERGDQFLILANGGF